LKQIRTVGASHALILTPRGKWQMPCAECHMASAVFHGELN